MSLSIKAKVLFLNSNFIFGVDANKNLFEFIFYLILHIFLI